jgi:SAM-dependent methyltransferase
MTSTPGSTPRTDPAAYDDFAWTYDRHWGRHTELGMETLDRLVLDDHPPPARVLDLCCGTGGLDRVLHARGYAVTGVDGSPGMIAHARRNAPECEFIVADARDFAVPGAYDLALCMYDSLNHLLEPDDLRLAFRSVRRALRPGAPFLFDLNMAEGYRTRWRSSFGVVEDDYACVVRSRFDESSASAELLATVFRQRGDAWDRSDVVLRQRCYAADEVTGALAAEGFTDVRIVDALADLGIAKQIGRSYFLASA